MAKEEIVNKQVSVETIIKLAELLEKEKLHYQKLGIYNKKFNYYSKKEVDVYRVGTDKLDFEITLKNGESISKESIKWFKEQLLAGRLLAIERIHISLLVYVHSDRRENTDVNFDKKMKTLSASIFIYENAISLTVDGDELEDEIYKLHADIMNVFNGCPTRFDKTIKSRFIRAQCLSLSIGFLFAYIATFALKITYSDLPETLHKIFDSTPYSFVILYWMITIGVGNIFGQAVTAALYTGIAPRKKYSHYDRSSGKSVYVDNVEEFTKECEVGIGKYHNAKQKRRRIETIFKVTLIIVAIQVVITAIYCAIIATQH